MSVDLTLLYDICLRLEESNDKDPTDFQLCIEAIKTANVAVKKLAIQIVLRYFDDFPEKRATALNTLMSQLTDPDLEVQKLIIKGLPSTCLHHAEYVDQVGDVLAQLLSIRDRQEVLLVKKSLGCILVKYPKATILAMYKAVVNAENIEEKVTMLKFMDEKVNEINGELTPFMKCQIAEIYKMMMVTATPDEIEVLLRFIGTSSQITEEEKQATFRAAMKCLVEKGIELDQEIDSDERDDFIQVVNNVVKIILILNSTNRAYVMPRKMTEYLFSKFGKLHRIHSSDRKDIMKVLSAITYLGNYEDAQDYSCIIKLFDYLKGMLPDPCPVDADMDDCYMEQRNEKEWDIEFSELELVSIVVYNVLQRKRFIAEELSTVGEIWKPKFQYLVNVIRVFTRRLKEKLNGETEKFDEDDLRNAKLLRMANNVGLIANCFLVNICDLHANISPSWVVRKRRATTGRASFNRKRRRRD